MTFSKSLFSLLLCAALSVLPVKAGQQQEVTETYPLPQGLTLVPTESPIRIDGDLDEAAWAQAGKLDIQYECAPGDNVPPPVKSEVLVTFDRSHLYVAFRCFDPEPEKIRAHLMDRDAGPIIMDDYVGFLIDTFNDERRAFEFYVNPLGVQADANYSELDAYEDFSWDAIWASAGKITDFGYIVEAAIPFNQLRFAKSDQPQTWGFEAERSWPRNVRHRMITHMQDRNRKCLLCQFNKIEGFQGISPGRNLQLTPALTMSRTDTRPDFPNGSMLSGTIEADPGITARWGITPNVMLNAALNPDFSQVEADAAQLDVNIRYALYYAEKRPFFLEGADFFLTPVEAVFTRTVADPLWGTKLTGKSGRSAFGFFLTQDRINNLIFPSNQGSDSTSLDQDVIGGVLRYRHDVGRGSTFGLLYTGRAGDQYHNHVGGLDGFLRLNRKSYLTMQVLHSQTRYPADLALNFNQRLEDFGGNALKVLYLHQQRNWYWYAKIEDMTAGFRADAGFVTRVDYRFFDAELGHDVFGIHGGGKRGHWFDKLRFWIRGYGYTDHNNVLSDSRIALGGLFQGPWQSYAEVIGRWNQERYLGILYDVSDIYSEISVQPAGGVYVGGHLNPGNAIDYVNGRASRAMRFGLFGEFGLGRHLNLNVSNDYERMVYHGARVYAANLVQGKVIYNFNTRCFLRALLQFQDLQRDPDMYGVSVSAKTRQLFTQFLFSYKLNPQTVLFLGYSDNGRATPGIDFTRTDRTFFLKIGYAWVQ